MLSQVWLSFAAAVTVYFRVYFSKQAPARAKEKHLFKSPSSGLEEEEEEEKEEKGRHRPGRTSFTPPLNSQFRLHFPCLIAVHEKKREARLARRLSLNQASRVKFVLPYNTVQCPLADASPRENSRATEPDRVCSRRASFDDRRRRMNQLRKLNLRSPKRRFTYGRANVSIFSGGRGDFQFSSCPASLITSHVEISQIRRSNSLEISMKFVVECFINEFSLSTMSRCEFEELNLKNINARQFRQTGLVGSKL